MSNREHRDDVVIELGAASAETLGGALGNQDDIGQQPNAGLSND